MIDLALDTAGQLRAMEAVFMLLRRLLIRRDALGKAEPAADQRRVVCISKRVMRRAARLNAHHFHRRFQRALGGRAVGLGVEDELGVEPAAHPAVLQAVERQIFAQNHDVIKAPRQENAVLAAPCAKTLGRLGERHAGIAQHGVLDACEAADLAVHFLKIFRSDQDLELVCNALILQNAHCADLHDLTAHGRRQRPFRRGRARPGLIPFHVQDNILHSGYLKLSQYISYHNSFPM